MKLETTQRGRVQSQSHGVPREKALEDSLEAGRAKGQRLGGLHL